MSKYMTELYSMRRSMPARSLICDRLAGCLAFLVYSSEFVHFSPSTRQTKFIVHARGRRPQDPTEKTGKSATHPQFDLKIWETTFLIYKISSLNYSPNFVSWLYLVADSMGTVLPLHERSRMSS
jgi:hypothetical protein